MRTVILVAVLLVLALGCAVYSTVHPDIEAQWKRIEPAPGKSRIYLLQGILPGADCAFSVDDVSGIVGTRMFLVADVEPGHHLLQTSCAGIINADRLTVAAGEVYIGVLAFPLAQRRAFEQLPDEAGRKRVQRYRMAWSSQLPLDAMEGD